MCMSTYNLFIFSEAQEKPKAKLSHKEKKKMKKQVIYLNMYIIVAKYIVGYS